MPAVERSTPTPPSPLWGGIEGGGTRANSSWQSANAAPNGTEDSAPPPLTPPHKGEGVATAALSPGTAIPLADTRHALPIALPFGSSDAQTLIAFLRAAEAQGVAEIRLAPGRQMLLLCASQASTMALRNEAAALGFITSAADPRAHIAACPGAPACASAYLPARDIALQAAGALGAQLSDTFSLHVSGCAKGCARQEIATITIVGDEKGAGCVVRGTAKDRPLAYTQPDAAVEGLVRVAALLGDDGRADAGKLAKLFERVVAFERAR